MIVLCAVFSAKDLYLSQTPGLFPGNGSPSLLAQLLTTLVVGLLTAFGLQLLLANLGIALGITALSGRVSAADAVEDETAAAVNPSDSGLVGSVGTGVFVSVNLVLFSACFLATKFSQVSGLLEGAIAGLTIWSAYLLVLAWVSTRAMNAIAAFLFDQATGGLRRMVSALGAALTPAEAEPITEAQMVESVRQEIQAALNSAELREAMARQLQALTQVPSPAASGAESDLPAEKFDPPERSTPAQGAPPAQLWQPLEAYLAETHPKNLSPKRLQRQLQTLLPAVQAQVPEGTPLAVPLETWTTVLAQRPDLSAKKQQRVLAQVTAAWDEMTSRDAGAPLPSAAPAVETAADSADQRWQLAQTAAELVLKQTLTHLPQLIQDASPYGMGLASLALSQALPTLQQGSGKSPLAALPLEGADVKPYLEQLLADFPAQVTQVGQVSLDQAEQLRDWAMKPVEQVKQGVQARITTLKQQAWARAEATRKAAALAAWWLFATASTGAVAAAAAGALATAVPWP